MADIIYGIDLGTTFTECAVINPRTKMPADFELDSGSKTMQSIVGLRQEEGQSIAYVGSAVLEELAMPNPELGELRVVEEAKRWMGTLDAKQGNDPPPWSHAGWNYIPQDIGAIILRRVKQAVDERMPEYPVVHVVITHPQNFTENQREATRQAAQIAGLEVATTITEPDAAAVCYGANREPGLYMIFDCGGGTLDITIARVVGEDRPIEVVTSDGLYQGGRDLDRCVLELMYDQYEAGFSDFDRYQHIDLNTEVMWLGKARVFKEQLCSGRPAAGGQIMLQNSLYEGGHCRLRLTKDMLEDRAKDIIEQFHQCANRALEHAKLKPSELKAVLLVGGTTKMPALRRMLAADPPHGLGTKINTELNPSTAIAAGAAKFARAWAEHNELSTSLDEHDPNEPATRVRSGLTIDEPVKPALAHGLGILIQRGGEDVLHIMVPKDTPLPHEMQDHFKTTEEGATTIEVELWEGNREDRTDGEKLGDCIVTGVPPGRPAGQPVLVRLCVAHNGQKRVEVVDEQTGQRTEMEINYRDDAVVKSDDVSARRRHIMGLPLL